MVRFPSPSVQTRDIFLPMATPEHVHDNEAECLACFCVSLSLSWRGHGRSAEGLRVMGGVASAALLSLSLCRLL